MYANRVTIARSAAGSRRDDTWPCPGAGTAEAERAAGYRAVRMAVLVLHDGSQIRPDTCAHRICDARSIGARSAHKVAAPSPAMCALVRPPSTADVAAEGAPGHSAASSHTFRLILRAYRPCNPYTPTVSRMLARLPAAGGTIHGLFRSQHRRSRAGRRIPSCSHGGARIS